MQAMMNRTISTWRVNMMNGIRTKRSVPALRGSIVSNQWQMKSTGRVR
jgi:hypothetical protein